MNKSEKIIMRDVVITASRGRSVEYKKMMILRRMREDRHSMDGVCAVLDNGVERKSVYVADWRRVKVEAYAFKYNTHAKHVNVYDGNTMIKMTRV